MLAEIDPLVRVRIGKDRMTGKARGFAFAEFSETSKAADAIRRFDGFEMGGRRLRVNDADDKPPARAPRPFTPGGAAPPARFGGDRPSGPRAPAPQAFVEEPPPDFGFGDGAFKRKGSRRNLRARKRSLRY